MNMNRIFEAKMVEIEENMLRSKVITYWAIICFCRLVFC